MKRAVELFTLDVRPSRSPFVAETWRASGAPADAFISVAAAHWEMVVTRRGGTARLTIRGPETRATAVPVPTDAEFFGVQLSVGTYMPDLPPSRLVDMAVSWPTDGDVFRLAGRDWELPGRGTSTEDLVDGLAEAGLIVHDPIVAEAVHGDVEWLSTRSVERRVARATDLSRGTWRRIRRAERAVELLAAGTPVADVAHLAGYADQPHLTRSLRRLVGQTPAHIGRAATGG